jgi:hypothetical protein
MMVYPARLTSVRQTLMDTVDCANFADNRAKPTVQRESLFDSGSIQDRGDVKIPALTGIRNGVEKAVQSLRNVAQCASVPLWAAGKSIRNQVRRAMP